MRHNAEKSGIIGTKAPDFDACGLFRATHSHTPIQYSHIVGLASSLYHIISDNDNYFLELHRISAISSDNSAKPVLLHIRYML